MGELEIPKPTGFKVMTLKTFPQFKNANLFYSNILRGSFETLVSLDLSQIKSTTLQQELLACLTDSKKLKKLTVELVPVNLNQFTLLEELTIKHHSTDQSKEVKMAGYKFIEETLHDFKHL